MIMSQLNKGGTQLHQAVSDSTELWRLVSMATGKHGDNDRRIMIKRHWLKGELIILMSFIEKQALQPRTQDANSLYAVVNHK